MTAVIAVVVGGLCVGVGVGPGSVGMLFVFLH